MEGAACPRAGATELWDIHSHVFTETKHRTYVYQASNMYATRRWGPGTLHVCPPCPGQGGTFAWRGLQSHLACPSLTVARGPAPPLPVSPQKASLGGEMQAAVTFSPLRVSIFCAACPQRAEVEAGETGVRLKEALPDHQGPGGESGWGHLHLGGRWALSPWGISRGLSAHLGYQDTPGVTASPPGSGSL